MAGMQHGCYITGIAGRSSRTLTLYSALHTLLLRWRWAPGAATAERRLLPCMNALGPASTRAAGLAFRLCRLHCPAAMGHKDAAICAAIAADCCDIPTFLSLTPEAVAQPQARP